MAHELTIRADNSAEMAYVGATPWHGLGAKLDEDASIETWAQLAGMSWRVQRAKVRYATERGQEVGFKSMDDKHVLFRSDTKDGLGIVSDKYKVVQPKEVLEFFRDLTEKAGFKLNTAGTLFGGRKFWALAKIGGTEFIKDQRDQIKAHLLLSTSCDGSAATEARFVTERVVCANTLAVAVGEKSGTKVRVSHRSVFRADEVKKELGLQLQDQFQAFVTDMRLLAATPLSPTAMALATAELLQPGAADLARDELAVLLAKKPAVAINRLAIDGLAIGSAFQGAQGTAWGWLNAVTEYVDHATRTRTQDNRLDSAWFGRGADLKTRALELVTHGVALDSVQQTGTKTPDVLAEFLARRQQG